MTISLRACILPIGVLLALSACTQPAPEPPSLRVENVVIPGTQVRQLVSAATGRSYDMYIRFRQLLATEHDRRAGAGLGPAGAFLKLKRDH